MHLLKLSTKQTHRNYFDITIKQVELQFNNCENTMIANAVKIHLKSRRNCCNLIRELSKGSLSRVIKYCRIISRKWPGDILYRSKQPPSSTHNQYRTYGLKCFKRKLFALIPVFIGTPYDHCNRHAISPFRLIPLEYW